MSATTSTKKKAKKLTEKQWFDAYMTHLLETENTPTSVYKFAKEQQSDESNFYQYFGSFEGLREAIWNTFFEESMRLAEKQPEYENFNNQEKMLTFFYTFFELLTANRSYVLMTLPKRGDLMEYRVQLKGLRQRVKDFAGTLIAEDNEQKNLKFLNQPVSVFSEGAWLQTLFLLKYWLSDSSPEFEKTDMAIEKSVRAVFDVFQTTPLESVVDFGKFLWKNNLR
ncbi:TetR/AcrR family transcriptional regulator [Altibacter sp. HG106]|uniref:TetR/AcrR family transcriptional regulator n=1 Tax=Altibacter sp. HG106 TaxID=3023937 RepID=UPI00234FFA0D|nr:TetR family transcriptional regulator C-terminal domain-containing protein [Altibacter sp. HG106]MDC7994024.1 TetR family transcriptional regulator C-terminal domain-containing protein [Altibacter sp. HG106]